MSLSFKWDGDIRFTPKAGNKERLMSKPPNKIVLQKEKWSFFRSLHKPLQLEHIRGHYFFQQKEKQIVISASVELLWHSIKEFSWEVKIKLLVFITDMKKCASCIQCMGKLHVYFYSHDLLSCIGYHLKISVNNVCWKKILGIILRLCRI